MILHSDDILEEESLKILQEGLVRSRNVAMSVGERYEIELEDELLINIPPFYDADYLIPGNEQAEVFLYSGFLPCQVLFRRSSFMKVGGAELGYEVNLDGLLWFKSCLLGDVVYTQRRVSRYRRHIQSETGKVSRTCLHLFEWYATHRRMLSYGKTVGLDFPDFDRESKVLDRLSQLATRSGAALDSSADILNTSSFRLIASGIDLEQSGKLEPLIATEKHGRRTRSFRPPKGSIRL